MRALRQLLARTVCVIDAWHLRHVVTGMEASEAFDHADYGPMRSRLIARELQLRSGRSFR